MAYPVNAPSQISIGRRPVGPGLPAFIVAEIAQAHDGSLGTAHAYIEAAAAAGVDAVKFQTHIAAAESTPDEPFRVKFSPQDATRYDYWKRLEFTPDEWQGLADHAAQLNLAFLSSAFSPQAVELLEAIGVPAWKVGAGEITTLPLLRQMAATGKPVLLSSGMSSWSEFDQAVETVRAAGAPVGVFQCTTAYPCPPEKIGLNVLAALRERYGCPVGLSDHSGTIYAGLAAVALGANMLEVHTVFSRECFGPDVPASVTTSELAQLVEGIRFIETALASPVDKDRFAAETADLKKMFGKGIVATRDLPKEHELSASDMALKKPARGIAPDRFDEIIGRRLRRAVTADAPIRDEDLE